MAFSKKKFAKKTRLFTEQTCYKNNKNVYENFATKAWTFFQETLKNMEIEVIFSFFFLSRKVMLVVFQQISQN
jgi:hypothetical protein